MIILAKMAMYSQPGESFQGFQCYTTRYNCQRLPTNKIAFSEINGKLFIRVKFRKDLKKAKKRLDYKNQLQIEQLSLSS